MEPILTIDNLNSFGGNMLRQGDKSQLKYRLRDVGNKNLGISSKSCDIKMYGRNYTTVVYETTTTVSSDNTVSFTINKVLPKGTFYLEFTVGDYIFPTDHREFFEITPSGKGMEANIIEIVGKDVLINAVKSQVDTELQPLVTSLQSAQQAETQRVSNETVRVSAEAQRKIDHANRSAELAGKADKVVLKNGVVNGDFSDGLSGWLITPFLTDNSKVVDGKLHVYGQNSSSRIYPSIRQRSYTVAGHKQYFYIEVSEMASNSEKFHLQDRNTYIFLSLSDGIHSKVVTIDSGQTFSDLYLNHTLEPGDVLDYKVNNLMSIDLTQTFGVGNEPTQEEMDELIKVTGYIDGEYALNNKEMLGYLMNDIREKVNKKQEDWITPTLLNGWIRTSGARSTVQYFKDQFGFVHIRGDISNGSGDIFRLPTGYRPTSQQVFLVGASFSNEVSKIRISTDGVLTFHTTPLPTSVQLNISFDLRS